MIPDFQTIMLPLLRFISDGNEYTASETNSALGDFFKLTEDESNKLLPSGSQKIFANRVAWAKSHLKLAGLIENTKRGHFKITITGSKFLENAPSRINIKILKSLPSTINFSEKSDDDTIDFVSVNNGATPEEIIESNYLKIRKNLALELLEKIMKCSPDFFENMVVELLVKMGYGGTIADAGKSIGRTGDEGIDGIIKEDRLGLDIIYIQAKRWQGTVGRPEIQKFVGALAGQGAKKGVFITTSRFTNDARDYQPRNETKIVLIDGDQLAELMIDFNLAVSTSKVFEIKRIDNDYFEI